MTVIIKSSEIQNLDDTMSLLSSSGNDVVIRGGLNIKQVKLIAEALKKNTEITIFNLEGCHIGDDGVTIIAEALEENDVMISLSLERNDIGNDGAKALAKLIKKNTAINSFKLKDNLIKNDGAEALAEALEINNVIIIFDLEGNKIGAVGGRAMAKTLKINNVIIILGLGGNPIGDDGVKALAEALEINHTIIILDLRHVNIGDAGATSLAKALKKNRGINIIELGFNEIGDVGAIAMAEVPEENNVIVSFSLAYNRIGDAGAEAVVKTLEKNPVITFFDLQGNEKVKNAKTAGVLEIEINVEFLREAIGSFHKNKLMSSDQFITLKTHLKMLNIYDDIKVLSCFYGRKELYESIIEQLEAHDVTDDKLCHTLTQELYASNLPQLTIMEIDDVKTAALGNILGYLTPGDTNSLALVVLPKKPILPDTDSTDYTAIASSAKHMLRFAPTVNYFLKIYGIELPQIPLTSEIRAMLDFKLGMIENHDDGLILGQALESVSYYAIIKNGELLNNNLVTQQPTDLTSLLRMCMPEIVNGAVTGITFMDPFAIGFGLVSGAAQCLSKHNLLNEESEIQAMIRFDLDKVVTTLSLVDICYNGATIGKFLSLINNVVMTDIATKIAFSVYEIPLSGHNIEGDFVPV